MNITILGTGTWGMALARALTLAGHKVICWSKFEEEVKTLSESRNHKNLPGMAIPKEIGFTTDLSEAVSEA